MQKPLKPDNEPLRLEALREYNLLDTLPEQALDDITALAGHICEAPISLISLVDEDRQWFKSKVGLAACETGRDISFCGHSILQTELFVVPDAKKDDRFADNPLVTGQPKIRFYAGAPLVTEDGLSLGTLCVIDQVPRELTFSQREALRILSRQVMALFELRRKSKELENREQLLRTIFDSEPECVKLLGPDGRVQMMNPAGLDMVEAESYDQVSGQCVFPLVAEKHRAEFVALTERVFQGGTGMMQFQMTGLKGTRRWMETHAAPLRDEQGNVTSLLAITRDISGRKFSEAELKEGKARLQLALDAAKMGNFDWDLITNQLRTSPWYDELHGFKPGEFDGSLAGVLRTVHPDDLPGIEKELNRCAVAREPFTYEFRTVWPDGSVHWLASRGEFTFNENSQPVRMYGVVRDVTPRREVERSLRHQQAILEETGRIAQVGGWEFDPATGKGTWTDEVARIHDLDPVREVNMELGLSFYVGESRKRIEKALAEAVDTGTPYDLELELETEKGNHKWVRTIGRPIVERGRVSKVRGSFQDITERKKSERALKRAHVDLERAQSIGHMGSWEYRVADGNVKWSDELYRIFGLEPRSVEITYDGILEMVHPEDRDRHNAYMDRLMASKPGERIEGLEFRIPQQDGRMVHVQVEVEVRFDRSACPVQMVGTVHDVTERKLAEVELRRQAQLLRLFVEYSPAAIAMLDNDMRYLVVSNRFCIDYGLEVQDLTGKSHYEVFPEITEDWKDIHRRCLAGAVERCDEDPFPREDGSVDWVRWEVRPWEESSGKIGGILIFSEVITSRKEAEKRIQKSEKRLRDLINGLGPSMFMALLKPDGKFLEVSRSWLEATNLKSEDLRGKPMDQTSPWVHSPEAQQKAREAMDLAASGKSSRFDVPLQMEDRLIYLDFSIEPVFGENGEVVFLVPSANDITERKLAENALRDSEEHLSSLMNSIDGIVWEADAETFRFTFVSPRAERLLGYPASRWTEEPTFWADQIHPDDRHETVDYCVTCTQAKLDHEFEYRMIAKDGRVVWLRDIVTVVVEDDRPARLRGVMVDVTNRKQDEESIKKLNRTFAVLSAINQLIVREKESDNVLSAACRIAVEIGRFRMAWIGMAKGKNVEIAAHAGASADTLEVLHTIVGGVNRGEGCKFTSTALETGQPGICNDIEHDPEAAGWSEAALQRGYRAMAALPLIFGGKVVGIFNLYAEEAGFFDGEELLLLDELAADISFALEVLQRESERRHALQALKKSESQLSGALKIARMSYWEYDVTSDSILANDHFYSLFHTSAEREGGYSMSFNQFIERFCHPEDRHLFELEKRKLLETTEPHYRTVFEHRALHRDGEIAHVSVWIFVMKDRSGRTVRTYGVNQDISDRKRAEEAIHRGERRFRALIEHSADSISLIDHNNRILYVSPTVSAVEGYSPEELIGRSGLEHTHPDDLPLVQEVVQELLENPGKPIPVEWRRSHKDGHWLWLEGVATNLLDDPAVGAIVTNYRDVTAQKQLEEELRQSQKMEAIGQLAGGVAHDFNNILTVINGWGSILIMDDGGGGFNTTEAAEQIVDAAERAANLTRQLLAFSRRQVMQTRVLDLNEIVTNLTKMLQRIVGEDVHLQLNLHSAPLATSADAGMLDQVLLNLVVNARDAMPDGGQLILETGIRIITEEEAASLSDGSAGRYVFLSVKDSGTGISPENLQRIFDPFFTTKEQGKGTGLGLATVFGIVKQHEGVLSVESEVGKGTTFRALFPESSDKGELSSSGAEKPLPRGGTETILLVEDDTPVRILSRSVLERAGYNILEAADGLEALSVWEEHHEDIQLVFTDIVMPEGVNGRELASRLRQRNPNIPVIFTSGYSPDIAGKELTLEAGQNFIQKPAPPNDLLETIRRCLDD